MNVRPESKVLSFYFCVSYFVVLGICSFYLRQIHFVDPRTVLFSTAVYLTYSLLYLLPALSLTQGMKILLLWKHKESDFPRWDRFFIQFMAIFSVSITEGFLLADVMTFQMFGFHMNRFVWNLVTTKGGIESMGGGASTNLSLAFAALLLVAFQFFLFWIGRGISRRNPDFSFFPKFCTTRVWVFSFVVLALGERVTFGVSFIQMHSPVLIAANQFPFYIPATFTKFAAKLGYKVEREPRIKMDVESTALNYPLRPLEIQKPEKPLNIVWLVSESWRADMLDPEIMPATHAFAEKSIRFLNHYSGGNGTRMGLFSMFYGLYGNYWFPFLYQTKSPLVMDEIQNQNYQVSCYTSARFSYPEFDKTLFAKVPNESLHVPETGYGWEKDQKNVGELLDFISRRDPARPFMTFMFFESPHARYYFPQSSVIRPDYLEDFNYATVSLEKDMPRIKNRYINACHHLDSQFRRVIEYLEKERLLDNTVVLMTGDHGEEFMEKGRWGHNSAFTEEQIRVPLILWIPGQGVKKVDTMTSHMDIPATILPLLGVKNPSTDYSLGLDLLGEKVRDHTVVSDWYHIVYIDRDTKACFPVNPLLLQTTITTRDDAPMENPKSFYQSHQGALVEMMQGIQRFCKKKSGSSASTRSDKN